MRRCVQVDQGLTLAGVSAVARACKAYSVDFLGIWGFGCRGFGFIMLRVQLGLLGPRNFSLQGSLSLSGIYFGPKPLGAPGSCLWPWQAFRVQQI